MTQFSDTTRKKIVKQHIQEGRTLASLAAEYGPLPDIPHPPNHWRAESQITSPPETMGSTNRLLSNSGTGLLSWSRNS